MHTYTATANLLADGYGGASLGFVLTVGVWIAVGLLSKRVRGLWTGLAAGAAFAAHTAYLVLF